MGSGIVNRSRYILDRIKIHFLRKYIYCLMNCGFKFNSWATKSHDFMGTKQSDILGDIVKQNLLATMLCQFSNH